MESTASKEVLQKGCGAQVACFVKSLLDQRLGPTWHVLVGRSFGFSVQARPPRAPSGRGGREGSSNCGVCSVSRGCR